MTNLFHLPNFKLNSNKFSHVLHDKNVLLLEEKLTSYVGAKYGVLVNSATCAIFLTLLDKNQIVKIPSLIPPVVINAILTSNNAYDYKDDVNWVGNSYVLHEFNDYKIIDSAQKFEKDQFLKEAKENDLMIFSFYPTKPLGGIDGGLIVSNDKRKIDYLKILSFNGTTFSENNWEREIVMPGFKFYMSSVQANVILNNFLNLEKKYLRLAEIRDLYNESFNLKNTSNHLYRINVSKRDNVLLEAKARGIICGIHYRAMHMHPVFKKPVVLPASEKEESTTLSIPFHEKLSKNEIKEIINFFKEKINED